MTAILTLGFLLGLQHAMEADHLAAVASVVAGKSKFGRIIRHGVIWGVGHAMALSAFIGLVILLRGNIPAELTALFECAVGLMLLGLGGSVLYRLFKDRIHFHLHRHRNGSIHFHAHSHAHETKVHDPDRHEHGHVPSGFRRSVVIGMMHGLAGSAAMLALSTPVASWGGIALIALFSFGSILGMVVLSSVVALPLVYTGRAATGLNRGLQFAIGAISLLIGAYYVGLYGPAAWKLLTVAAS